MKLNHRHATYLAMLGSIIWLSWHHFFYDKEVVTANEPPIIAINRSTPNLASPHSFTRNHNMSSTHASASSQITIAPDNSSETSTSNSASSSSSKKPFVPRNWISAREHKDPSLRKYSAQIPRLFSDSSMFANGARYVGMTIEWYREKMLEGDVAAKFYYSNNLFVAVSKELYQDYLLKGDMIDVDYWKQRFEEPRKLAIECAVQGISVSAGHMIFENKKLRDPIDSMAWALIEDAMSRERDINLTMVCLDPEWENQCTDANLTEATNRALMMIDLYGFKVINKK